MEELQRQYREVCAEQSALRSQLMEVGIRKMELACRISRVAFGKSDTAHTHSPTIEQWRAASEANAKNGTQG